VYAYAADLYSIIYLLSGDYFIRGASDACSRKT